MMKQLIFLILITAFVLSAEAGVVKRDTEIAATTQTTTDGIEVDSRFGFSDVKDFASSASKKVVGGAKKVGHEIGRAADYVKDGFLSGYDYLKRKIKPNKDGLDYAIDVRTLEDEAGSTGMKTVMSKRETNEMLEEYEIMNQENVPEEFTTEYPSTWPQPVTFRVVMVPNSCNPGFKYDERYKRCRKIQTGI